MIERKLHEKVSSLGFPMFIPENDNVTLAEVVKSNDLRLWEGFPVMLANALEHNGVDIKEIIANLEKPVEEKKLFSLLILSIALYKVIGTDVPGIHILNRLLSENQIKKLKALIEKLRMEEDIIVSEHSLSGERLKENFIKYYKLKPETGISKLFAIKDEANLEYSLSQIFSSRQKDLIFKKLNGEKFTKTEREYFSRSIKKKLNAITNPDLLRLAQRVL